MSRPKKSGLFTAVHVGFLPLVHTNAEHTESKRLPDDLRARLEASIVA